MRRGFTILELLVASLLLGMLVTILTMIFNQSSIAWRTGVAGVADLDMVRQNLAEIREEADNIYIWNDKPHRLLGLWDDSQGGRVSLRTRAIDSDDSNATEDDRALLLTRQAAYLRDDVELRQFSPAFAGNGDGGGSIDTYTVNVMSAGPDKEFNTWDDVWSYPDDFE